MQTALFKLKKDKVETWKAWLLELEKNPETLETLKEEGMLYEFYVVFEANGEHFCFAGGEGEFKPATDRELNRKHNEKKKECFDAKLDTDVSACFNT